jgi:hypothetical protein
MPQRFRKTFKESFFGDFIYSMAIPEDHFLVQLDKVINWEQFTPLLIEAYKGKAERGEVPYQPIMILKMLLVILARYIGEPIWRVVEEIIEGVLGLRLNRDKTRMVNLLKEGGSLDFLGFTFRRDRDLQGRSWRYLNVEPSKESLARLREKIRGIVHSGNKAPIGRVIEDVNKLLTGWANYFRSGYPRKAFRRVNHYVWDRLTRHLLRRSQRRCRQLKGPTMYAALGRAGLVYL